MRCDTCEMPRMLRALPPDWSHGRDARCIDGSARRERLGGAERSPRPSHGLRAHAVETLVGVRRLRPHTG